jgi:hypothetical protein
MPLSAGVGDESVEYYPPYRVGENTMRALQTKAGKEDGQLAVYYRELNLESLTVTDQQARFDFDFNRTLEIDFGGNYGTGPHMYTQSEEAPDVLGLADNAEIVYLQSMLERTTDDGRMISTSWIEIYNNQADEPVQFDAPSNFTYSEKRFYQNHLITTWFYFDRERVTLLPGVYDLETGDLIFDSANKVGDTRDFAMILPFGENWLVAGDYGLGYVNQEGLLLKTEYFEDITFELMSDSGYYTVTQPLEP